ncbi:hypothetical protein Sbal625DRAFT_3366 [Shewanella baltica OS625]|nr:hypothetical protein Sbal625DRAFT_3366 [Shewanella baltica OS625]
MALAQLFVSLSDGTSMQRYMLESLILKTQNLHIVQLTIYRKISRKICFFSKTAGIITVNKLNASFYLLCQGLALALAHEIHRASSRHEGLNLPSAPIINRKHYTLNRCHFIDRHFVLRLHR